MFEDQYVQPNVKILENRIESHLDAYNIGKYVANSFLDKKNEELDFKSTPSLTQNDLIEEVNRTQSRLEKYIDYDTKRPNIIIRKTIFV